MIKKWMDFIETGPAYVPVVRKIEVKQYGIAKVVVVRTKQNGGVMTTTEKRITLRQDSIPAIEMWESISASVSDKYLTIFRMYKQGKDERSDMVLLSIEEAKELLNFLKENV